MIETKTNKSDKDIKTWDHRLNDQVRQGWENYKHVRIDLSTARIDFPILIAGEFIYVEERSGVLALAKIKLNRNTNDALDLEKGVEIYTVFKEVYITNDALQGEWLDLVFGINFIYKKKIVEEDHILFGGPGCVAVTPRFDFTAGQVWVLVDDVFVQYLVSGVAANIPLAAGQSIEYVASEWDSITLIDINGDNVVGDISGWSLPAALQYFNINTTGVTGDISGWILPANLITFYINTTGVTGDISGWILPAGMINLAFSLTGVTGDISGWILPATLVYWDINFAGVTGDISGWVLPAGLFNFSNYNVNFTGDISGWILPAGLNTFVVNFAGVTGDISGWVLPVTLVYFYVHNTGVTGDISGWVLPAILSDLYIYTTSLDYIVSPGAFVGVTNALVKIDFDNCLLVQANVDNVLADCVASLINNKRLDLAGTNAAPSAAGLLDKATLIARGWIVATN